MSGLAITASGASVEPGLPSTGSVCIRIKAVRQAEGWRTVASDRLAGMTGG